MNTLDNPNMNTFQVNLYQSLMALVSSGDVFYFQDFVLDDQVYRIFNYRLASYTEFLAPGAMECRGVMFEVQGDQPKRLAALPMSKFFNINENPITMNLDLAQVDTVELKADGSLISTYMHNGVLRLKSKGSLFSDQANDALAWLNTQPTFCHTLTQLTDNGWSVNSEWCAPTNRIVIGYMKPHLTVLNARHISNGKYLSRQELEELFQPDQLIGRVDTNGLDAAAFVASVPGMLDDIEGYVIRMGDLWFKIKTDKYLSLHHAKDSITNPRRLFEAILDEGIDDLRSMFVHDQLAIQTIDEMQFRVDHLYNHMVKTVDTYHQENKHLDRKTYAINGQEYFKSTLFFGLAMNLYTGKENDYKAFLKGKWRDLGFRDGAIPTE